MFSNLNLDKTNDIVSAFSLVNNFTNMAEHNNPQSENMDRIISVENPVKQMCSFYSEGKWNSSCNQIGVWDGANDMHYDYTDFGISDFLSTQINTGLSSENDFAIRFSDEDGESITSQILMACPPGRFCSSSELESIGQVIPDCSQICATQEEKMATLKFNVQRNPKPLLRQASEPVIISPISKSPLPYHFKRSNSIILKSKNCFLGDAQLIKQCRFAKSSRQAWTSSNEVHSVKAKEKTPKQRLLRKHYSITSTWEIEAIIEEGLGELSLCGSDLDLYSGENESILESCYSSINDVSIIDEEDEELISELEKYAYSIRIIRMKRMLLLRQDTYTGNIAPRDFCI